MGRIITHSGTHGSGKTVSMLRQAADMMCSYPTLRIDTITGTARRCPFPINKQSTGDAQLWIFTTMVTEMLEKSRTADIVICDRAIYDVIGYTVIGAKDYKMADWMLEFVKDRNLYDQVIFHRAVENEWCCNDGIREVDPVFRYELDAWLSKLYHDRNIPHTLYKANLYPPSAVR